MPTVPITAAGTPAPVRPVSSRRVVVVFPWVPVTPTVVSMAAGSPYTSAEARPSTARTAGTTSVGTSPPAMLLTRAAPSASVRIATAPAPRACGQYVAPCARSPGTPR